MITVMRGCNSVYKLGKIAVMEKKMSSVMFVAVRNLIIVINGITILTTHSIPQTCFYVIMFLFSKAVVSSFSCECYLLNCDLSLKQS